MSVERDYKNRHLPDKPSEACYMRGCRDPACRAEHTRRNKVRARARASRGSATVIAEPMRRHLNFLHAHRIPYTDIAAAVGVAPSVIYRAADGRNKRTRRDIADRTLALHVAAFERVPAVIWQPLLTELVAEGVSQRTVMASLGYRRTKPVNGQALPRWRYDRLLEAHRVATAERVARQEWDAERQRVYRNSKPLPPTSPFAYSRRQLAPTRKVG